MKVVITDHKFPHVEQERDLITKAGAELVVAQCRTPEEVLASCRDADILMVQWAPVPASVIAGLERCRLIVRYGIGVDNVDLSAAASRGIPVCNVPDYCIDEVADHSVALALALSRQLPQTDAAVREGVWKITPPRPVPAFRETLFATAGFGRIARAVLARAKSFGFALGAYDPFVDPAVFAEAGVRALSANELFSEAGVLSLHLPLTTETKHFVNRERLRMMKDTAVVVNTARGGLIDTLALAEVLQSGHLLGAGLDVFEGEPLAADHPLRSVPNTILTSHTAWYSEGSVPQLQRKTAEAAVLGIQGLPLIHVVNGVSHLRTLPPD